MIASCLRETPSSCYGASIHQVSHIRCSIAAKIPNKPSSNFVIVSFQDSSCFHKYNTSYYRLSKWQNQRMTLINISNYKPNIQGDKIHLGACDKQRVGQISKDTIHEICRSYMHIAPNRKTSRYVNATYLRILNKPKYMLRIRMSTIITGAT